MEVDFAQIFQREREPLCVTDGTVLFETGDAADAVYVVLEGAVELWVGERCLWVFGVGEIVGEVAMLDGGPRCARAVIRGASRLVKLDEKRLSFLLRETPYFAPRLMQLMALRLREIARRAAAGESGLVLEAQTSAVD